MVRESSNIKEDQGIRPCTISLVSARLAGPVSVVEVTCYLQWHMAVKLNISPQRFTVRLKLEITNLTNN